MTGGDMMNDLFEIQPEKLNENVFHLLGKDWMLITAGTIDAFNTMTASWGGMGVLWNKNVCYIVVTAPAAYLHLPGKKPIFSLSHFFTKNTVTC